MFPIKWIFMKLSQLFKGNPTPQPWHAGPNYFGKWTQIGIITFIGLSLLQAWFKKG